MTCDNCGAHDDELSPVHRVYYQPTEHVLEETEHWCVPCMTQYPYEVAEP
ncbi:MAG TPA: hypothetical protein VFP61_05900 [Acidimicrobiales bacterium]|nr:hypothetical protein [Acidimicrobiales bacterium]